MLKIIMRHLNRVTVNSSIVLMKQNTLQFETHCVNGTYIKNTPSVPNYKTSQESWRVKTISSLTKIIERNIKIYDIKLMYYENIINKKSNGT